MTTGKRALLCIAVLASITTVAAQAAAPVKTAYDYSLVSTDGNVVPLSTYKGKVLLIVNLASQSVYKSQVAALEELQKAYADKGLVVLGIPSADFGAEELSDNTAILHYYRDSQHVTFPIFSKSSVRGKDSLPLVHFLTDPKEGAGGGDIHWNFTKFLVDSKGQPVLRFEADSDPADPEFRVKIEQVLNGTYKKKNPEGKDASAPSSDGDDDGGE
jgi:glutathione peroxidase